MGKWGNGEIGRQGSGEMRRQEDREQDAPTTERLLFFSFLTFNPESKIQNKSILFFLLTTNN